MNGCEKRSIEQPLHNILAFHYTLADYGIEGGSTVKLYLLNHTRREKRLNSDGQPLARDFQAALRQGRNTDELIGICRGCVADGEVSEGEARFVTTWLQNNKEIREHWPGSILWARIDHMLSDGVIDEAERKDLFDLMSSIGFRSPRE